MRIFCALVCLAALALSPAPSQNIEVGSGSPNDYVRGLYQNAFLRNGFNRLVSLPPVGAVRRFGPTGYIQEFNDASASALKHALVKADASVASDDVSGVFQVLGNVYGYYNSVGVAAAGYPVSDTQPCPAAACQYQLFDKGYALFVYAAGTNEPAQISLQQQYFTRWNQLGGVAALGPPVTGETDVASSGTKATVQVFAQGALYNMTSGTLNGRFLTVKQPIWSLYQSRGAHTGQLGLPVTEELQTPAGKRRQSFQGGTIEYAPSGGGPVLLLPVSQVQLVPGSSPVKLNLGDTIALRALITVVDGTEGPDRSASFTTSNGRVVSLTPSGSTVMVRATGGGTANITAVSEGKTSAPVAVIVNALCCQVGEGAPNNAIQQAFIDLVTRFRLPLRIPGQDRVRRVGSGYVQEFFGVDPNSTQRYLLAVPDRSQQGYILTGDILVRYDAQGGPTGALGYPASDITAGGRQLFEGGALAGAPPKLVSGGILQKWASLGYEAGSPGLPAAEASAIQTFTGTTAKVQTFRNGVIAQAAAGPQASKAYFVGGLILARYNASGGARGPLGLPIADESGTVALRRQEFEGGAIEYAPGATEARIIEKPRRPSISASPAAVVPGTRVRIVIAGFPDRATLRVSITGQQDFTVSTPNGAYVWDAFVPANAAAGTVKVRAIDIADTASAAEFSYTIRSNAEIRAQLSKVTGDAQTGGPGAVLPIPLRVSLKDESGNPISGVNVRFTASPGAAALPAIAMTGENGEAEAAMRLPSSESIALVTVEAMRQVATFTARATSTSLANFPKLQTATKNAMLAAVASIIRYHQNRGDLPLPNGAADIATLEQFLRGLCQIDAQGQQYCDGFITPANSAASFVNLWRAGAFVSNLIDVSVEKADVPTLRDLITGGSPVLIALALQIGGAPAGVHFLVGTGVAADGAIVIADPSGTIGRANLNDYLTGFTAAGKEWRGTLTGAVRLLPRAPSQTGFLVTTSNRGLAIGSQAGDCGITLELPDALAADTPLTAAPGPFLQRYCDGSQSTYQIEIATNEQFRATITDLLENGPRFDVSGRGNAAFSATRPATQLNLTQQQIAVVAGGVVNAATFTSDIAPGGMITIFGSGLARAGGATRVEINSRQASVIAAFPFQLNVQLPSELAPGSHVLRIASAYGALDLPVEVQALAPAIFRIPAAGSQNHGAILNQDGGINQPSLPAPRGSIISVFGTGFGPTRPNGPLFVTQTPANAKLHGQQIPVTFLGLAPGFLGLYQANVRIPTDTAPGLDLPLTFQQGTVESTPVEVSIQ